MDIRSLEDLESRGFVVVPGFLTPEEIEVLRDDDARLSLDDNRNFHAKTPSAEVMARLAPRFDDVLRQVNQRTSVRADVYVPDTSVYTAPFQRMFDAFDRAGTDEMSLAQLLDIDVASLPRAAGLRCLHTAQHVGRSSWPWPAAPPKPIR